MKTGNRNIREAGTWRLGIGGYIREAGTRRLGSFAIGQHALKAL